MMHQETTAPPKSMRYKQVAAILSLVTLGVCAAAFIVSSGSSSAIGAEQDDIRNVYGAHIVSLAEKVMHSNKALRGQKIKLALIDPSQEKDLDRAIQTAFKTFAAATNETVIAQSTSWDPAAMEGKVADNIAEIKVSRVFWSSCFCSFISRSSIICLRSSSSTFLMSE